MTQPETPQTTDAGDRCPKCGAALEKTVHDVRFWRCGSSFPAPDQIVYSGLIHKGFWQSDRCRIRELTTELSRLRAIVDGMPKTADGVAIAIGLTVYCPKGHKHTIRPSDPIGGRIYCCEGGCWYDGCQGDSGSGTRYGIEVCFSAPQKTENDDE